jgi:hypothetical protein
MLMSNKRLTIAMACLIAGTAALNTGCFTMTGPSLGIFSVPIPVSPHWQKKREDEFHIHERYARVPILGPVTSGGPVVALDPPSDDEVWRALERANPVQGGIPFFNETQRNNVTMVKEKIADYIDPPRVVPLIGPAQLHHAHYKCTIYYTERKIVGWPIPHTLEDEDSVEVIYIDHNHFHMVGDVDFGESSTHY